MARLLGNLGVRSDEVALTGWMAALFAVTQASHGVGANAADALFFSRFGVDRLPLMILISGPVVMAASLGYSAGLARRGERAWLWPTTLVSGLWVVLLWAAVQVGWEAVYPVIWVSAQALILVTLTVMWNAASSATTTRQAKRLFPMFATAGVAGGVLGNLSVGPLAALFGTENLLVVQAVLLFGSSLTLIKARGLLATGSSEVSGGDFSLAVRAVASSRLLRLAVVTAFLFSLLFFLVVFPFSEVAAASFPDEAELAGFLGLFSSLATGATFVFSLLVTNRLFARFGLVLTLLLVPVVYATGFGIWLAGFGLVTAAFVRGTQWVAVNAIQGSGYAALFNVLGPRRRGPVLALMSAVPAQVGTVVAGLLLMVGAAWADRVGFTIGLAAALIAIVVVAAMRTAYVAAVVTAVRRGLISMFDRPQEGLISPVDGDLARVLRDHLADERPRARALAAAGLGRLGDVTAMSHIEPLLTDSDALVRSAAFESACVLQPEIIDRHLADALADEAPVVRLDALRRAASLGDGEDVGRLVSGLLDDEDFRVRAASSWMVGGEAGITSVSAMMASGEPAALTAVLDEAARHPSQPMGIDATSYLDDPSPDVRTAAVAAHVTGGGDPANLVVLLDDGSARVRSAAARGLAAGTAGRSLLVDVLRTGSVLASEAALRALTPFDSPDDRFVSWARDEASRAAMLDRARRALEPWAATPEQEFLVRVLSQRGDRLVQWVLLAMTTAQTAEVMSLVARGVRSVDSETRAQAIEALESLGARPVLTVLLPLLEDPEENVSGDVRETLEALAGDFDPWLSALARRWLNLVAPTHREDVPTFGGMSDEKLGALDEMERVLVLQRVDMFADLDPEDLALVAHSVRETHFDPGEVIYRQGEEGEELMVIVDGEAVVSTVADGERRLVSSYGPGEPIGELALLTNRGRSADVHAGANGLDALVMRKGDLIRVLEERPTVAMGMLGTLATRLFDQT